MFSLDDLYVAIDLSGQVWQMTGGYHVSIRAELRDSNPARPHGLDYGLTLMGPDRRRILGFDNSHSYDGAPVGAPFDHEHRHSSPGRTFPYGFTSAAQLMDDLFDRVDAYIEIHLARTGTKLQFDQGS